MPLFVCENPKCGVIENTALSMCSWGRFLNKKKMLCSQCCPEQKKWHNRFPREKWTKDCKEKMMNKKT